MREENERGRGEGKEKMESDGGGRGKEQLAMGPVGIRSVANHNKPFPRGSASCSLDTPCLGLTSPSFLFPPSHRPKCPSTVAASVALVSPLPAALLRCALAHPPSRSYRSSPHQVLDIVLFGIAQLSSLRTYQLGGATAFLSFNDLFFLAVH